MNLQWLWVKWCGPVVKQCTACPVISGSPKILPEAGPWIVLEEEWALTSLWLPGGKGGGRWGRIDWEFGIDMYTLFKIDNQGSLVVQWLRICLPMQGTRVRTQVQEDPTCRGATKRVRYNYWACALEPMSHNYWAHMPQLLKPARLAPVLHNKRSHCNEKPANYNKE